jgi:hypothetical protein
VIRFNPPPLVTEQDYSRLAAELLVKIGDCQQLVDPWFRLHRGYNPGWSPRPPEGVAVKHLWQVVVSGLPAGEMVALVDSAGQELMTANGTGAAPVRLSALVAPGGERELSIARIGAWTRDIQLPGPELTNQPSTTQDLGATRRGLEVRQTPLVHLNSIPLPARSQNLVVTNLFGGPYILATLDEGVAAFDFSNPHRPVLVGSWRIEGVRGALNWQGALLVFGKEGVECIDRSGRRSGTVAKCELSSILDAAGDRQALYALTDEGVDVYSKRLCRIGAVPLEGGQCLARVGRTFVAGARRGLTIFETAKPRHLGGYR